MKLDVANEWADMLDSGKYPQGIEALCLDGKFCCLGVLSELAVIKGIIPPAPVNFAGRKMYGADQNTCTLPAEVQEWAGISNGLGEFWSGPFEGITLAFLNDSAGHTFPEIAQIIRENIDAL